MVAVSYLIENRNLYSSPVDTSVCVIDICDRFIFKKVTGCIVD